VPEAAGKANRLAAALVGENRERVEQKKESYERAAGRSCVLNEGFHGAGVLRHFMVPVIAFTG